MDGKLRKDYRTAGSNYIFGLGTGQSFYNKLDIYEKVENVREECRVTQTATAKFPIQGYLLISEKTFTLTLPNYIKYQTEFPINIQFSGDCDDFKNIYKYTTKYFPPNIDSMGTFIPPKNPFIGYSIEGYNYDDVSKSEVDTLVKNNYANFNIPMFDPCTTNEKPIMHHYNVDIWSFDFGIINGQGLVIKNIKANNQHLFNSISIPHIKIEYGEGLKQSKILRFCGSNDPSTTIFGKPIMEMIHTIKPHETKLSWDFTKEIREGKNGLNTNIKIYYNIYPSKAPKKNCEISHTECYRFIPELRISQSHPSSDITTKPIRYTAYYKLDFGPNIGLAATKDASYFLTMLATNLGRQSMVTKELQFNAVKNGQQGLFDNIHTAHPTQSINIPGCRLYSMYDCVHMHWRWPDIKLGGKVDPMVLPGWPGKDSPVEEKLRGTPYLVSNSEDTTNLDIAIVKFKPGEEESR